MKQLFFLIFSFSLLSASDKISLAKRFSDLTPIQKERVNERLKRYENREDRKQLGRLSHSEKISREEYNQLRNSGFNIKRKQVENKKSTDGRRDLGAEGHNNSAKISAFDQSLYGRWHEESSEESVFITLNSAVTIPDFEQYASIDEAEGKVELSGSDDLSMTYLFALNYTFNGWIGISNYSWFEDIPVGSRVYDLWFSYWDNSISTNEEFIEHFTSVNLRHPTSGNLQAYNWATSEEDENYVFIPFGGGDVPEGSMKFGGGLVGLVFDGAGNVTISDPLDPTNTETDSYSVSDNGTLMTGEGPSGMINSDGSVVAFLEQKEGTRQGMVALGFKGPETSPNLASFQGTYYGTRIARESEQLLGTEYVFPNIETFAITFDGAGDYSVEFLSDDGSSSGTYAVDDQGMLVLDGGAKMGFMSADSSYGVWATSDTSDNSDDAVGLIVKEGAEKSAASLEGTFSFASFEGDVEIGQDISINFGIYTGTLDFDGAGTYTISDGEESETGTYDVSATGFLTVDGEDLGFVGPGDDVILFASKGDYSGGAGVAIKQSTGMTNESLAGDYGVAFLEVYSDYEVLSIEDYVTVDFFNVTDSEVHATVVDEYYDEDGELWIELRYPPPTGITINNLEIQGYNDDGELAFEINGDLSYDTMTFAANQSYPLPSIGDFWDEDEFQEFFLEFESNKLGREIESWSYILDDGTTEEWTDTTDFVWSASNDTLTILTETWEWNEETGEEYKSYEKDEIPYSVESTNLTLGGRSQPCEYWEDDDWYSSWEECIQNEYPFLNLAISFMENGVIEEYYEVNEEKYLYKGTVPSKPTKASTLPMVANMPNIFMEDIEVSGNRLYGGGYANFDGTLDRYLRILDISNPLKPKELDFSRPGEDDAWGDFDMVVKGNTVIVNTEYGPDFYDVSGDKISGLSGSLLSFNGSDDYVVVSDPSDGSLDFGTGDFTFSVWFNTDKVGDTQQILCKRANDYGNYEIQITSNGKLAAWVGSGSDAESSTVVSAGTWYNAIVSRSGTAVSVYLNGTQDFTFASSESVSSPADLSFGQDSYGGERFDGFLDDVAIWNTALTSTQKTAVYNAGRSGDLTTNSGTASSSLVGYWKFSETSGSVLSDASTNSNDGTIYGANWHNSDVFSVQDTKCCYGQEMALQGNNLYIPRHNTDPALRIIDVTVPTQPSVTEVTLSDLNSNTNSDGDPIVPYFDDIKANDSYVFILDQNAGDGTDTCWEDQNQWDRHSVVRIHSTTSPYSQVALVNIKAADMIEIDAKYIYTVSCGNFYVYDYSDLNNIKEVGIVKSWSENEEPYEWTFFESFNGEIEKIGDYIYIARGGYDGWDHLGVNVIDVSDPTKPVHLANIPGDIFAEGYRGGYDYPAKSVEVNSGYLLVAQQSSPDDVSTGNFYVYQTDFAPQPFSLIFPPDGMKVEITEENAWEESITFAWNASADVEGNTMNYTVFFDKGLDPLYYHILDACEDAENTCTIPLHRMKNYLYLEGVLSVSGVWDVLATDGVSNTYSSNGPYKLTIDASTVATVDENNLPMDFALHSNFPNPFNPTTSIKYDLPEDASVSLMIYDIMGREIRHLVNETQNAGFKAIMWDGTNNYGHQVGTGMYLYQIKAGSFVQTRKMILMK